MASIVSAQVTDVISEASGKEFEERLRLLENILNIWKRNKTVNICTGNCSTKSGSVSVNDIVNDRNIHGQHFNHDHDYMDSITNTGNNLCLKMNEEFAGVRNDVVAEDTNLPSTSMGVRNDVVEEDNNVPSTSMDHEFNNDSFTTVSNDEDDGLCMAMSEDCVDSNQNTNKNTNLQITNKNPPSTITGANSCEKILLPPRLKRRGKPKGFDTTVIGLPRKKSQKKKKINNPVPFHKMKPEEKKKIMLTWLVNEDVAAKAMEGKLIEEENVEVIPDNIPSAAVDETIDLSEIQEYFTTDGWSVVEMTMKVKRKNQKWFCKLCQKLCGDECVRCDGCLEWLHFKCIKIKIDKRESFFCKFCSK